jgi:thiol-disulfide isomerase/thioredoxin
VKTFIRDCLAGKLAQHYQSELPPQVYRASPALLGTEFKQKVLQAPNDSVVFFWKPGCGSCKVLSAAYEELARVLQDIQVECREVAEKRGGVNFDAHENRLINKFYIKNPAKFKDLQLFRYMIYNESPDFTSPGMAPLMFIFKNGKKRAPIRIDVASQNMERFVRGVIRFIDEH